MEGIAEARGKPRAGIAHKIGRDVSRQAQKAHRKATAESRESRKPEADH